MTKQLTFFMLGVDEGSFQEVVESLGGVLIYHRSRSPKVEVCRHITENDRQEYAAEMYIALADRLDEIYIKDEPVLGWYLVDRNASTAIQFHRSTTKQGVLSSGRLWAQMETSWWTSDEVETVIYRGRDFELLYDNAAKWIRRTFKKDPIYGFFCGPEAFRWISNGGEYTQF